MSDNKQEKDWYAILGVSRDASSKEIDDVFDKAHKKYHPDRFPLAEEERELVLVKNPEEYINNIKEKLRETQKYYPNRFPQTKEEMEITQIEDPSKYIHGKIQAYEKPRVEAQAKFKEISEAYDILGNPSERQRYDQGFDVTEEFKKKGWADEKGKAKKTPGNVGGASDLEIITNHFLQQEEHKGKTEQEVLFMYFQSLASQGRYNNLESKSGLSIGDYGLVNLAEKAITENYLEAEDISHIVQERIHHVQPGSISHLEAHIDGMYQLASANIGINTKEEMDEAKEHASLVVGNYIIRATLYNEQYHSYDKNPAEIYEQVTGAKEFLQKKFLMEKDEISDYNKGFENDLYEILSEELDGAIEDGDIQLTKWNLDMIKYISPVFENYGRFDETKRKLENTFNQPHLSADFIAQVKQYAEIKDSPQTNYAGQSLLNQYN